MKHLTMTKFICQMVHMNQGVDMELDQMARHNYFVKYNEQIGVFEVLCADRNGQVMPVQTNIRTESKADQACMEWCDREMVRVLKEIIDGMARMMRKELERQRTESGDDDLDLHLLAASALVAVQVYIKDNAAESLKN